MGVTEPDRRRRRGGAVHRAEAGRYKKLIIRDGRLVGAILLGDIEQGRLPDAGLRPRHAPARRAAVVAVRPRRAQPRKVDRRRDAGRDAGLQLQRRHQGRDRRLRHRGKRSRQGGDGSDPRRHGMRLVQGAGRASWSTGSAAARRRRIPSRPLLRARQSRSRSRSWSSAIRDRGLKSVSAVFARSRAARRTPAASPASPRCSIRSGPASTRTSATPASSTTACTATSRRTARSR